MAHPVQDSLQPATEPPPWAGPQWRPWNAPASVDGLTVWAVEPGAYGKDMADLRTSAGLRVRVFASAAEARAAVGVESPPHLLTAPDRTILESLGPDTVPAGVPFIGCAELYERILGRLALAEIGAPGFRIHEETRLEAAGKRLLDLCGAGLGLLVTLPLAPVLALVIWMEDRHSVFYVQERLARNGVPFRFVKFRTMSPPAGTPGQTPWHLTTWTDEEARFTRIGRWLRQSKLDEITQFVHVLSGRLSLVGPRPESVAAFRARCGMIPRYEFRLHGRPGIVPWGYLRGHDTAIEKLQSDLYYLKHRSLAFDLAILFRTAAELARKTGRKVRARLRG